MRGILLFCFLAMPCSCAWAQKGTIMFYNVENLFDTEDDSTTSDNEFLPQSQRKWTSQRYYHKLGQIYKAISSCAQWDAPVVIGLCEVENRYVVNGLALNTELSKQGYRIAHSESADVRGIDCAVLYNPKLFRLISFEAIRPQIAPNIKTRDIAYCKGLWGKDSLHVFVNHWPSRRGGQSKSEWKRMAVSHLLKQRVDSILARNPQALIVVMGDFNDELSSPSIQNLISPPPGSRAPLQSLPLSEDSPPGSLKYRNRWYVYDHILVSHAMSRHVAQAQMSICKAAQLQEPDTKNMGTKPFRSYAGMKYIGGYSDHLPVFIRIAAKNK